MFKQPLSAAPLVNELLTVISKESNCIQFLIFTAYFMFDYFVHLLCIVSSYFIPAYFISLLFFLFSPYLFYKFIMFVISYFIPAYIINLLCCVFSYFVPAHFIGLLCCVFLFYQFSMLLVLLFYPYLFYEFIMLFYYFPLIFICVQIQRGKRDRPLVAAGDLPSSSFGRRREVRQHGSLYADRLSFPH